jgi:hypothetical protein
MSRSARSVVDVPFRDALNLGHIGPARPALEDIRVFRPPDLIGGKNVRSPSAVVPSGSAH